MMEWKFLQLNSRGLQLQCHQTLCRSFMEYSMTVSEITKPAFAARRAGGFYLEQ